MIRHKFFSICRKLNLKINSSLTKLKINLFIPNVNFGKTLTVFKGAYISCTDGGEIEIGRNVSIGSNAKIIAQSGTITIGDNVHIGDGVIITSKDMITIGNNVLIAEYVVIRDQNHNINSIPYNCSGYTTAPISIADNVWLGAKVSVLKGVSIGENVVIGAHALVSKSISQNAVAVGIPAKVIKTL